MFFKKVIMQMIMNCKRPMIFDGINMIISHTGPRIRRNFAEILPKKLPRACKKLKNEVKHLGNSERNVSNVIGSIGT